MSYNPNSWSKCEVPTALALKSCSASRMVPVSANLDIRNDPGKVVKWWSLSSEARRGRNEAVRLLLHCLRLLSPLHCLSKHVPRKHPQKSSTEVIPIPLCVLSYNWKCACICVWRGGNTVAQRNGTQARPSLGIKILLFLVGVAMMRWALSLLFVDI